MAKTSYESVDAHIAAQSEPTQSALAQVRQAIRRAVPEAEETISYAMPAYMLGGTRMLYFAGWRQHYSIYAATASVVAAFGPDLAPYRIEKGTIRFPVSKPVPVELIERIARFRAAELRASAKARI